jgi:tRNA (mo5U34)-methyltransferase
VSGPRTPTAEDIAAIERVAFWWHAIDLGGGVLTPGIKGGGGDFMQRELEALKLPDLHGRSVLDIGAWDGFYSFAAERLGAGRVVALDHFAWEQPSLGGGSGFDIAHRILDSSVEKLHRDFMTCDVDALGRFDVVLFLGVLYHLEEPLTALRRLYALTGDVAVIETAAVDVPDRPDSPLLEFYPADELGGDATNWYAPNLPALHGMCRAAGFSRVETIAGPPPRPSRVRPPLTRRRGERPAGEPLVRYRATVHAYR